MANPNVPTLLSPNGGEIILTTDVTISWQAPSVTDGRPYSYELFFCDRFDPSTEPDWRQIAILPSTATSFSWRPTVVKGTSIRIAIRTVNSRGERSNYVISAANFTIQRRKLTTPTVVMPTVDGRYDKYIYIQVDDSAIAGTQSQRTYYQFYYSSIKAGIASTSIAQDVPIGSDPVLWNIIDLPPADDYIFEAYLEDDAGNTSDRIYIPITIAHEGYFIVDTVPPEVAIKINNGDIFTRSRPVSVEIVSYDATTAVHSMQLRESSLVGKADSIGGVRSYTLSEGDEIKAVELLLQDYGGNRNDDVIQRLFDVSVELTGTVIVDFALNKTNNDLWTITAGTYKYLYQFVTFPARKTTFTDTPTAVAVYESYPYIATKNTSNVVTLIRYSTVQESIYTFTSVDSVINCMIEHNGLLYMGMESGFVYSYDTANVTAVDQMAGPLKSLISDGNLLYAVCKNDPIIYVFDGSNFISTST